MLLVSAFGRPGRLMNGLEGGIGLLLGHLFLSGPIFEPLPTFALAAEPTPHLDQTAPLPSPWSTSFVDHLIYLPRILRVTSIVGRFCHLFLTRGFLFTWLFFVLQLSDPARCLLVTLITNHTCQCALAYHRCYLYAVCAGYGQVATVYVAPPESSSASIAVRARTQVEHAPRQLNRTLLSSTIAASQDESRR